MYRDEYKVGDIIKYVGTRWGSCWKGCRFEVVDITMEEVEEYDEDDEPEEYEVTVLRQLDQVIEPVRSNSMYYVNSYIVNGTRAEPEIQARIHEIGKIHREPTDDIFGNGEIENLSRPRRSHLPVWW